MPDDISATYRGFRKQALYILSRILTDEDSNEKVYRPEGVEDLAVFNSNMQLVEAVQVKDHSKPLTVSDLKPGSEDGFISRLFERQSEHPQCATLLASYGPIGTELLGAINNMDKLRSDVADKISQNNVKLSKLDAEAILESLGGKVSHPSESALNASVRNRLRDTSISGNLDTSIELLMYWIFEASENQRDLTKRSLLSQLDRISSYLAEIRDFRKEWGTTITAVKDVELTEDEISHLINEYRKGVQAKWEHIVAGADCIRKPKLEELRRAFRNNPVVVVRGASGQGKSSLSWRYLNDCIPEGIRFAVNLVEGREQAIRISNALSSHVCKLNLDAVAYVDVAPSDLGWKELAKRLSSSGLKVLVSIREEDFQRANVAIGDFNYSEVILDRVTTEEAEEIYNVLRPNHREDALDFEEAWARFDSQGAGPLLEFTHLVSEGESLDSRIASQIQRLQQDATNNRNGITQAHLDFLAVSSIANETGARVSLDGLCDAVGISAISNPLHVLENEYLLKEDRSTRSPAVVGLHQLRSKAVIRALFLNSPDRRWSYAVKSLQLVVDEDIETFLLTEFTRKPESKDELILSIQNLNPRTWIHAAGIARALIWEGVSRYELRNEKTILSAMEQYGSSWWCICDTAIGMGPGYENKLFDALASLPNSNLEPIPLTSKEDVFSCLKAWAKTVLPPEKPNRPQEWAAVGEVSYWISHCDTSGKLRESILTLLPESIDEDFDMENLCSFVSGRSRIGDAAFNDWQTSHSETLRNRFIEHTKSLALFDDGKEVKVLFAIPIADSVLEDSSENADWHGQTMRRIRILRDLYPNHETYSAQSVGLEFFIGQIGYDPTKKEIPVESLPNKRNVEVNSIFANLASYRHLRVDHWKDYVGAAYNYRRAVSDCFRKLHRGWSKLMSEPIPRSNTIKNLPGDELEKVGKLSDLPMFPKTAVDEWGNVSEDREPGAVNSHNPQKQALRRFKKWEKAFNDYSSGVGFIVSKVVSVTALYVAEKAKGHKASEAEEKEVRLSLINFSAAWEALSRMQQEFRERFGRLVEENSLDELERFETSNFRNMWPPVFAMFHLRSSNTPNLTPMVNTAICKKRTFFLDGLKEELSALFEGKGTVRIQENPWVYNKQTHLCVVCDYEDFSELELLLPQTTESIWRASKRSEWALLEWESLVIEWENIAVVNLVRGKALVSGCSIVPVSSFFSREDSFEPQFFEYAQQPIESEDFLARGFKVWESPLIRAAIGLLNEILSFTLTCARLSPLLGVVEDKEFDQNTFDHLITQFGDELEIVLSSTQKSYSQLDEILEASNLSGKDEIRGSLKKLCQLLIFETVEESKVELTIKDLTDWAENLEQNINSFKEDIYSILNHAIAIEPHENGVIST